MTTHVSTDEEIQRDVLEELKWDMRVHPNEVGVSAKGGIVTLTGWVDSYMKKLAAEAAAHRGAFTSNSYRHHWGRSIELGWLGR